MTDTKIITREDKLKVLGLPIDYKADNFTDDGIDKIYNEILNNPKSDLKGKKYTKISQFDKVDHNSDTYKITLAFLNDLLKLLGKQEIAEIIHFKDINRDDIINPICNDALNKHLPIIINHFGKTKIRYNDHNDHKHYILTVIKYLTRYCGHKFTSNKIEKSVKTSQKNVYEKTWKVYYNII